MSLTGEANSRASQEVTILSTEKLNGCTVSSAPWVVSSRRSVTDDVSATV